MEGIKMIYTLTLNPSIDYVVHMDAFISGITNRTAAEEYYVGGKGINVSCILSRLGHTSTALGFTAGFTGREIENVLRQWGIHTDFVRLKEGISRINVKVKAECESEINAQGPPVSREEWEQLLQKTDNAVNGDTFVLAGSIPPTVVRNAYECFLQRLHNRNVRVVVDAAGQLLMDCLAYRPFLIKPNRQELSELFGTTLIDLSDIQRCALTLRQKGARNVLVSLGAEGAVLFAENGKVYHSGVVPGKAKNTVGAGDSMVAGFLSGYEQQEDYAYALKWGTACANATAFSLGLAEKQTIWEMFGRL